MCPPCRRAQFQIRGIRSTSHLKRSHCHRGFRTYVLAFEAASGTALLTQVLIWGAAFWVIVAVVAWANGGSLTRRQDSPAREAM
jgi:hypothetical protein